MSWLSKKLGGNTLKVGAALLGSVVAKEYIFGETSGGDYSSKYLGAGFNKLGIDPFRDTAIGSFLSPALDNIKTLGSAVDGIGGFMKSDGPSLYDQMPQVTQVSSSARMRGTNNSFSAGRAQMIPLGSNGNVNRALSNPSVQSYLAKRASMVGLPSITAVSPTVSATSNLTATTASKRRQRSKLVS